MRKLGLTLTLMALPALYAGGAFACFGAELKIAVPGAPEGALAAYTTGYLVEEKTGIAPEFVEENDYPAALASGKINLALAPEGVQIPKGAVKRDAGTVGKLGKAVYLIRAEVLDDIRFTTVEKALGLMPGFFSGNAYRSALDAGHDPKKAARKAVLDGN